MKIAIYLISWIGGTYLVGTWTESVGLACFYFLMLSPMMILGYRELIVPQDHKRWATLLMLLFYTAIIAGVSIGLLKSSYNPFH